MLKMSLSYSILIAIVLVTLQTELCNCKKVTNIYWNTTTMAAMEAADQPKLVVVNEGNGPTQYDQVNLICPVYKPGVSHTEKHIIYSVDKDEFDSCRVTNPRPRIVAICNRPQTFMYFTITFRSFTPTPGGLEFRPGKDYYFISTSNTRDIHRRVGGWCSSHNMKMIFRVAENAAKEEATSEPPTPAPAITAVETAQTAFWSKYWNARVPGHEENYIHDAAAAAVPTFPQTDSSNRRRINPFSDSISREGKIVYLPREVDESVDITITASALSSGNSQISTSVFSTTSLLMLLSLVMLS